MCEGRAPAKCRLWCWLKWLALYSWVGASEHSVYTLRERRPGWIILRASGVINIKLLRFKNETAMRGWWACALRRPHNCLTFCIQQRCGSYSPALLSEVWPKMNNQCWFWRFVSLKSGWLDFFFFKTTRAF